MSELEYLARELLRLVQLYEHYRTGTVKWIAQDLAKKIASMLE